MPRSRRAEERCDFRHGPYRDKGNVTSPVDEWAAVGLVVEVAALFHPTTYDPWDSYDSTSAVTRVAGARATDTYCGHAGISP